jgi:putative SOS response-associated peptidase YedK
MCGRYSLDAPGRALAELLQLPSQPALPLRYNIAPTQPVPVARDGAGGRELVLARWGLVPHWAQDPSIGNRLINARSETVAEKPSFRDAFRKRRCLVPATGFYESLASPGGKQPFHFRLLGGRPFAFAGLWERWDKGAEPVESCTILTTEANAVVRPVHERMPVILRPEDFAGWLDPLGNPAALQALLRPYPAEEMEARAVGRWVNDPRHEGADCLTPAG